MQADPTTIETTEDALLGGKLTLRQPARGHRAGHDAVLLAAATPVRSGERIADLGAGAGQAGLAVVARARAEGVGDLDLLMIEREPALAQLAADNAARNGVFARAVVLDLEAPSAAFTKNGIAPDSVDRVLMNPPFNEAERHRASEDVMRSMAHVASGATLGIFIHAARRMLKPQGMLTLIWRADGLDDVLQALTRGFGNVSVTPVYPRQGDNAIRILVGAVKGGRRPLVLTSGLILHEASGAPTPQTATILRGDAAISFT